MSKQHSEYEDQDTKLSSLHKKSKQKRINPISYTKLVYQEFKLYYSQFTSHQILQFKAQKQQKRREREKEALDKRKSIMYSAENQKEEQHKIQRKEKRLQYQQNKRSKNYAPERRSKRSQKEIRLSSLEQSDIEVQLYEPNKNKIMKIKKIFKKQLKQTNIVGSEEPNQQYQVLQKEKYLRQKDLNEQEDEDEIKSIFSNKSKDQIIDGEQKNIINVRKSKKQMKLQEQQIYAEGTFEINKTHESLLRFQRAIDEFLAFKYQNRRQKVVTINEAMDYMKATRFGLNTDKFFQYLLIFNKELYRIGCINDRSRCIYTKPFTAEQIQERLANTRKKMTQVQVEGLMIL